MKVITGKFLRNIWPMAYGLWHPSRLWPMAYGLWRPFRRGRKGQAMTEVVLLFPLFMIIVLLTAKIFALLVLVQKMEIASFYAARRWQLESHLNADYAGWDQGTLRPDIEKKVKAYMGFNSPSTAKFLNLRALNVNVVTTQVWNVVTLTVETNPAGVKILCKYPKQAICAAPYGTACNDGYDYLCVGGKKLEVVKYVPSRDRPIQFILPGMK
ncbi:MAG TPA: hypothetical protein DER10_10515 [Elusimicrobia bacterium]|nr:MAG: hypothetical protein A2X33_00035 [Elusimicrobia bacterium GWA2_51_34]HCE98913.1 hypothetical protein [Elusimicrobiota bacterium]